MNKIESLRFSILQIELSILNLSTLLDLLLGNQIKDFQSCAAERIEAIQLARQTRISLTIELNRATSELFRIDKLSLQNCGNTLAAMDNRAKLTTNMPSIGIGDDDHRGLSPVILN